MLEFVEEGAVAADGGGPGDALRGAFDGEDEGDVEGEVEKGPDLLADGAEEVFVDPVEVDHVHLESIRMQSKVVGGKTNEVKIEDGTDDSRSYGSHKVELIVVVDDVLACPGNTNRT